MGVQKLIKKFLKTGSLTNLQKNYREDLPNSAEEVKQRIRNAVALLTIEEIRNSYKNFDVGLNYAQKTAES
jgi:5-methylcytosine-specific restriction endonuclease McrBC GTP-binding regulatory subunit McrB